MADFYGNDSANTIKGTSGADNIYGNGGTDTLYGYAGNDVLKSGTGAGKLFGGDGDDQLYYNPTAGAASAIGSSLSSSLMAGDGGRDTLHFYNDSTDGGKAGRSFVTFNDDGFGYLNFSNDDDLVAVGRFSGIETLNLYAKAGGGADYIAPTYGSGPTTVNGTIGNDYFYDGFGVNTLNGGAGNDTIDWLGGNDTLIGGTGADTFNFTSKEVGNVKIKGFEGAGVKGGDMIHLGYDMTGAKVTTGTDYTKFDMGDGMTLTVDVVGLVKGVDYDFNA